jgi:enolase
MQAMIAGVRAREILDSRGNPTVEAEVTLSSGVRATAAVPSGASTGAQEAVELRDGDPDRYGGKGVRTAVGNVAERIGPAVLGRPPEDQAGLDEAMIALDGSPAKARLGANAILALSLACARAAARQHELPLYRYLGGLAAQRLPVPLMNVMNGGVHAHWQGPDFQEYMLVPYGASAFREALQWGSEVYHALRDVLSVRGMSVSVGDEGGFVASVRSNREPLDLIVEAVRRAGLEPGRDIGVALDPAASAFAQSDGRYRLRSEGRVLDSEAMIRLYEDLSRDYPLCLLEDGLGERDWSGWQALTQALGAELELVGDDILCTNPAVIERAIADGVGNAALIKPNQIGTLSETMAAARLAQRHGWGAMVSHRSGETADTFIADLTVALDTGHLKSGAPARGERVEKYNQLLRIEEDLGPTARFAGKRALCRPIRF